MLNNVNIITAYVLGEVPQATCLTQLLILSVATCKYGDAIKL
jgi:hypothetical protein